MRNLLREEVAESYTLDPTRPAAIGGAQRGDIDKLGDVACYNGDGARLYLHPSVASAVTGYGSAKEVRPGIYDPHLRDMTGQPEFPWRGGQAIWSIFDHGSVAGAEGTTGIVDFFRLPKRGWYWYRNALLGTPPPAWPAPGTAAALKLTASSNTITHADGTDDVQVIVTIVKDLQMAGKICHVGLSEVTVEQIEQARKVVEIVSVQNEYNIGNRKSEKALGYCEKNNIAFIPWFPVAAGKLAAPGGKLDEVAKRYGATVSQLSLAWLLYRSPVMLPIPGTSSMEHLEENLKAADVVLSE